MGVLFLLLLSLKFSTTDINQIDRYKKSRERVLGNYYNEALDFYKTSQILKVRTILKKIFTIDSTYKPAVKLLAQVEKESFKSSKNAPFYETVKELYERAMVFYRNKDYKNAKSLLKLALSLDKTQPQVNKFYNDISQKLDSAKNEVKFKNTATTLEVRHPLAVPKKIKKKRRKKKSTSFVYNKEKVKLTKSLNKKGLKYYLKKKYNKALFYWEQVLKLDPKNERALNNIKMLKKRLR